MPSGLSIQDGVYIEEPVRMRVDRPAIVDGGPIFDGKSLRRRQNRQPLPSVKYEAMRRHRCSWCGSTHMTELNRESVSHSCPNCGGPK